MPHEAERTHPHPVRRRITIAATALACLIAADVVVRMNRDRLAAYTWDPYQRKLDALDAHRPPPQILLLGSSRANYALDSAVFERLTGRRVFNAGLAGTKVLEWQCVAEDHILAAHPELVVLGVNASAFRADYLPVPAARSFFDWGDVTQYTLSDGWSNEVVGDFLLRRSGTLWATLHQRDEVRLFIQERLAGILPKHAQLARETREQVARPCAANGYEHPWLTGTGRDTLQTQMDENGERVWSASIPAFAENAPAFTHFAHLLDWFHAKGIPLVIAYIPNSPRTEARWCHVEPQIIDRIAALCDAAGVPFIPCDDAAVPRTNADFVEEVHVALPLARRISERIARTTMALGLLKPDDSRLAQRVHAGEPQP